MQGGANDDPLPPDTAVSVMTLAELQVGVLMAAAPATLSDRLRVLSWVRDNFEPLPVTQLVADRYATMSAESRKAGRKFKVIDGLIAATAATLRVPVYTQDSDFDHIPGVEAIRV